MSDILNIQVCMEVPETECELVGYTECDSTKNSMPARDDKMSLKYLNFTPCSPLLILLCTHFTITSIVIVLVQVVGEFFYEQDCSTRPITVTEMKMQPECVDQKKVTVKCLHRK